MEKHDESRLAKLFEEALARTEEQRSDFLDRECGGDAELRQRLGDLLSAHVQASPLFLGMETKKTVHLPFEMFLGDHYGAVKGDRIGAYELLDLLGEGGFGQVWRAIQKDGVRRQVALKIIKPGMDTKEVIARFERERQALASMNHPHIAKVFDAGITKNLRPYFVMEYVEGGLPLVDYCNKKNLALNERLALFIPVCDAIQHAHRKQFIHRDLKPENILVATVDNKPVPKIIDFGITKALAEEPGMHSLDTGLNRFIGSLRYASPEQLEGLPLDVGTDVYSLGVVLYELITGRRPFDDAVYKNAREAAIRTLREEMPPKPSTRLQSIGNEIGPAGNKGRTSGMRPRSRLQRDEIDCIVLKCLEKESDRRYSSAADLAEDLQRYLRSEPILARPPSLGYRMQKYWRRHHLAISAGATVACSLVVALGMAIALVRARDKSNQELQSEVQAKKLEIAAKNDTYDALINAIFFRIRKEIPGLARGDRIKITSLFCDEVLKQMEHANDLQVRFLCAAGGFYREMKDLEAATNVFTIALEIIRKQNLNIPNDKAACLHQRSEAEEGLTRWVFDHPGPNSRDQRRQLLLQAKRDDEEARSLLETNPEVRDDDPLTEVETHLAGVNRALGDFATSFQLQTQISTQLMQRYGNQSDLFAISESNLGLILRESGNWDEARQHYQRSLDIFDASDDKEWHHLSALARYNWGRGLLFEGQPADALDKLSNALESLEREFPDDKEKLGAGHSHLAMAHIVQKEFEEAKKELRLGEMVTGTQFFYSVPELEKVHCAVCLRQKYQGYLVAHGSPANPPAILLAASEDLQVPLTLLPAEMHAPGAVQTLGGSFPIHHAYRTPTVGQVPSPAGASKSVPLVQCRNHAMTLFSDGSIQMSPE